jgi:HD-GYP domain-containing protein (c-di-GMP phosphodiesterase class II)
MFQRHDYTLLDRLTEICEVVDFNLRYLYVNEAAAKREQHTSDQMIGRTMLELHPGIESTRLFRHLRKCLQECKPVEFEDDITYPDSATNRWKIKIDPVTEGAFLHSTAISPDRTKVKLRKQTAHPILAGGRLPVLTTTWTASHGAGTELAEDLQIEGWLEALDSRTRESTEHIIRVAEATVALARMAELPESEIIQIRRGALLHDIGKIGIPDAILLKAGRLTTEEWQVVRKHPLYAYDLFYPIEYLRNCLSIPYAHHEKWDGSGYPRGLKGKQIPLPARLFAVVDVWDVLSCDRVYGKAWPQEKIAEYIQGQSERHFDPEVVDLFFSYAMAANQM